MCLFESHRKRNIPRDYFPPRLQPEYDSNDELLAHLSGIDIVVSEARHAQRLYFAGNFGTFIGQRMNFANSTCFESAKPHNMPDSGNKGVGSISRNLQMEKQKASEWIENNTGGGLLHLSPVEALYLHHDLNILKVIRNGLASSSDELFRHFQSIYGQQYVRCYLIYRYFRQIGWVVRDGLTFGVNFLLYKDSIELQHACAGVCIIESMAARVINDHSINALQRELANCKKQLLIAAVEFLLPAEKIRLDELNLTRVHVISVNAWNVNMSRTIDLK